MILDRRVRGAMLAAACALALASARASAEEVRPAVRRQLVAERERWLKEPGALRLAKAVEAPEWGVDSTEVINVHAYAFQANTSSDLIRDDGFGYRFFAASGVPYMAAPVVVPPGAQLGYLSLSACVQAPGDIVVGLYDNGVGGSGSGGGTLIQSVTAGAAGCDDTGVLFGPYTYASAGDHPLYLVAHFAGAAIDGSIRFNNVTLAFNRSVSPAPETATFNDVPTTDPAFQHVEALVASGVTAGCGPTTYCPGNFVTRRQMAVFLAKALGLHWPN